MPTISNTFKVQTNTIQAEVFEVMKKNPNKTSRDLHEFLPHLTLQNVSAAVNALKVKGLVTITDHKREASDAGNHITHRCYSVDLGKAAKPTTAQAAPQSNLQVDILNDLIKTLKDEITELEQWKRTALVRYPELSADPIVLKARELVAEEALASGDFQLANATRAGLRDDMIYVRATIRALEKAND